MTTKRTKEEIFEQLEYLAHKATDGQWWIDSHGHAMMAFLDDKEISLVFKTDPKATATRNTETGNLSNWENDWDASYIACAQPRHVLMLLEENKSLKAEIQKLRGNQDV